MDEFDGIPRKILGVDIKVKAQITLACLVTAILELLIYLIVTVADISVTVQHFRDGNPIYAGLTFTLICLPAISCFLSIMFSSWQWPEEQGCHSENFKFFLRQSFNLILFPIGAIYRYCRRIFWSIEALFQDQDTYEYSHAVSKAIETSPFELYHFLQAFLQAAPQIMLQLYILLRENIFRNYETTHVQMVSIIFSLITMAIITASFQRFESQKIVGRDYPWSSTHHAQCRRKMFQRTKSMPEPPKSVILEQSYVELPQTEHIMKRFKSMESITENGCDCNQYDNDKNTNQNNNQNSNQKSSYLKQKSMNVGEYNFNENIIINKELNITDHQKQMDLLNENNFNDQNMVNESSSTSAADDTTVDNKPYKSIILNISTKNTSANNIQSTSNQNQQQSPTAKQLKPLDVNAIEILKYESSDNESLSNTDFIRKPPTQCNIELDRSPDQPPPPPPPPLVAATSSPYDNNRFNFMNRLSTFKDMMFLNAELYIKENVPRLPPSLFDHKDEKKLNNKQQYSNHQNPDDDDDEFLKSIDEHTIENYNNSNNIRNNNNNNEIGDEVGDEVDFILPTRKKMIDGIEQDEFLGKSVAFTAWVMFLFMRILALSAFSVFYPWECLYLCLAHYGLMLCCIFYETKFHEKIERIFFYLFLAYIYLFCLLEFKLKFKKPRNWYIGYVLLTFIQNLTITLIWYIVGEFESWWFDYMFATILISCLYSILCLLVYYFILRPKDKILFENE